MTCVTGSGSVGCEAQGKALGLPFRPGVTGEGKAGRVNDRELSLMRRNQMALGGLGYRGFRDRAVERRQAATEDPTTVV